jgi:hypothetical protein
LKSKLGLLLGVQPTWRFTSTRPDWNANNDPQRGCAESLVYFRSKRPGDLARDPISDFDDFGDSALILPLASAIEALKII